MEDLLKQGIMHCSIQGAGVEGYSGSQPDNSIKNGAARVEVQGAKYAIRPADPNDRQDRAAIQRLWIDNLPYINSAILSDRFDWLYRKNPAGQTLTWFAVDIRNGAIVGCASVLPREMVVGGKLRRGGIAIDFVVDRMYRSFGIALQLQRVISTQVWELGIELMFGFPNDASRGVFQRIGYQRVGGSWRGAQLIKSYSKLRQHNYSLPVAMIAGAGMDLVCLSKNTLSLFREQEGMRGVLLDALDERWELFWNRTASDLLFAGAHDLNYLRWRYQLCPGESSRYFCLLDELDSLLGYLVFSRKGDVLMIDDIQVLEARFLRPLLARFWKEMRKTGAIVINVSVVGSTAAIDGLIRAGFVTRDTDGWAGMLTGPGVDIDLPALLEKQNKNWYMGNAEIDL